MRKLLAGSLVVAVLALLPSSIASATDTVNNSINNVSGSTIFVNPQQTEKWGDGSIDFTCNGPYPVGSYQTSTLCDARFDAHFDNLSATWEFTGTYNNISYDQCVQVIDPAVGNMEVQDCSGGPVKVVWPFSAVNFNKTGGSCYTLQLTIPETAAGSHGGKQHTQQKTHRKHVSSCGSNGRHRGTHR